MNAARTSYLGRLLAILGVLLALLVVAPSSGSAATAAQRLDLRVLLIGGGSGDVTTDAWRAELRREGVAFTEIVRPGSGAPITRDQLVDPADPNHGLYNGIILGTESSAFWGGLDEVYKYEREFGVRQLDGFEMPRSQVGLVGLKVHDNGDAVGDAVSGNFLLTGAGLSAFPYLRGPVDIGAYTWGYLAKVDPSKTGFTPYLQRNGSSGSELVLGVYSHPTVDPATDPKAGVEEMVMTINYNDRSLHWRLLSRGMIDWVTKGAHFGYVRSYLSNQVDDVLLPNQLWNVDLNCTYEDDVACAAPEATVRMTQKDVQAVVQWQKSRKFKLDMTFNGSGYAPKDPLSTELVKQRGQFAWTNHTWTHPFLGFGCLAYDETVEPPTCTETGYPSTSFIVDEIKQNQDLATKLKLPFNRTELVTGEHSGLDNPNLEAALAATGVTTVAADNSRQPDPYSIGAALTSPRYPSNVYYNVSTWAQQLDEYNWIYFENCTSTTTTTCRTTAATQADFLNSESQIMLDKVLSNDPRVGFSHQSNLTGDRIILVLLDRVLKDYRTWAASNMPLVTHGIGAASAELQRKAAYDAALAAGQISGYVQNGQVTITTTANLTVPITVPMGTKDMRGAAWGSSYAGSRSAWQSVSPDKPLVLTLP